MFVVFLSKISGFITQEQEKVLQNGICLFVYKPYYVKWESSQNDNFLNCSTPEISFISRCSMKEKLTELSVRSRVLIL